MNAARSWNEIMTMERLPKTIGTLCHLPTPGKIMFPGVGLELVLADDSELIPGQVHKQQNRRQFPIKVELVFRNPC
jgi:hypothetical protein